MLLRYYPKPVYSYVPSTPSTPAGWVQKWTAQASNVLSITDNKHEFNMLVTTTQIDYPVGTVVIVQGHGQCKVLEYIEMRGLCHKNILHNQMEFIKVVPIPVQSTPRVVIASPVMICPKQIVGAVDVTTTIPTA